MRKLVAGYKVCVVTNAALTYTWRTIMTLNVCRSGKYD